MSLPEIDNVKISESKEREFVFGCFNHARKMSDETITLFAKIIKETNSILLLKSVSFKSAAEEKRLKTAFQRGGMTQSGGIRRGEKL